ncbi:hypothetical protein ABIC03_002715 [Bradyrhizobium sp. RT6a]|uniref:hypothetical protein n=1 Tax=unclassified Bradyrhizobium TaxID=2631580 RepID=UPI0033924269
MIIFPFGFYILEGKRPVYVGNDLEVQKTVRSWMGANPEKVRLSFDQIGSAHILTKLLAGIPLVPTAWTRRPCYSKVLSSLTSKPVFAVSTAITTLRSKGTSN